MTDPTVTLRPAAPADAAAVLAVYAPYVRDTVVSFETDVPGEAAMADRIAAIGRRYPFLAAERDGVLLGYAYAAEHRSRAAYAWNAELSVYLAPESVGLGLGSRLYSAVIALLSAQNFRNVYGGVTAPNPRSERLHERLGFTVLGVFHNCGFKMGRWLDVIWYERHLGDPARPPRPVIPFPELDPAVVLRTLCAGR